MTDQMQYDQFKASLRAHVYGIIESYGPGFITINDVEAELRAAGRVIASKFQLITFELALEFVKDWQAEAIAEAKS